MQQTPYAIEREVRAKIAKLSDGANITFDLGPLELEVSKNERLYGLYLMDKRARDMSLLTLGIWRTNPDAERVIAYQVAALHILNQTKEALVHA